LCGVFLSAELPVGMKESIKDLEFEASRLLALQNFKKAEQIYDNIFTQIYERQFIENRRIHQGAPLHMKGISLLFQNKFKEALLNFVLAYITDTVNYPVGEENNADRAPAHYILKEYYNVSEDTFNIIKNQSKNIYINRIQPFNPQKFLHSVLLILHIDEDKILKIAARIPNKDEISTLMIQFLYVFSL